MGAHSKGPLTEREKDYLRELFSGMSRQELRQTVDKVKHIYLNNVSEAGEPVELAVYRKLRRCDKALDRA